MRARADSPPTTSSLSPPSPLTLATLLAFLLTLPLYLATMCRTVGFIDRGELMAAAYTFGIPHATGYPTLMLIAGAVAHAVPLSPALVLNALAAVWTAGGVAMLTLLLERMIAAAGPALSPRVRATHALLAALFVALTLTWWQQANGFEVYAFHALLMPLVVWLHLRWCDAAAATASGDDPRPSRRAGLVFALVLGLSFTNHLTTVLLAPGLLVLTVARLGVGLPLLRRLARMAPAFLLGLVPYLWLPIRSRMEPRFDWGDPETLRGLLHHVSGADYRGFMFQDPAAMMLQTRFLLWRVPSDFAWVGLAVALLGAVALARRAPALLGLALSFVAGGAAFAIGYRIPDIEAYLMTAVLGLALCFAAGLARVAERFGGRAAIGLAVLLVAANGALHWRDGNESGNRLVRGFVTDLLGPLPRDAVLFTAGWEIGEGASLYFQEVEGYRRDVVVVSTQLVRARWYLDELERREPELVARAGDSFPRYRAALRSIEAGDPESLESRRLAHDAFMDALAAGAMRDRPVFTMTSLPEVVPKCRRVPWHLALRLTPDSTYLAEPSWRYAYRPWPGRTDLYAAQACRAYAGARIGRARYEESHGRNAAVPGLLRQAAGFDPRIPLDRVGPLPLGFDRLVIENARFFRDLEPAGPLATEAGGE